MPQRAGVERESQQGMGSTGKSMGGVRAQFATSVNIRMSLYSIPVFAAFKEITGHPSEYKSHGYLFVATAPAHLEYLRRNFESQIALGLQRVEMLGRDEIVRACRNCATTTFSAAVFALPMGLWILTAS